MNKTVILYSPKGGSVDHTAKLIHGLINEADCFELNDFNVEKLNDYQNFVIGGSTVGADVWQDADNKNHWASIFDGIKEKGLDLSGKTVSIFGLGNQVLYPDHFVDGMLLMKEAFVNAGAKGIGEWPTKGYDFTDSKAVVGENFIGLAIDEDNEDDMTNDRCEAWVKIITKDFV